MLPFIECFAKLATTTLSSLSLFTCCPFQFQVWRNVYTFCTIQQSYVCVSNFVQRANCHLMFCQAHYHSSPVVHFNFKCEGMCCKLPAGCSGSGAGEWRERVIYLDDTISFTRAAFSITCISKKIKTRSQRLKKNKQKKNLRVWDAISVLVTWNGGEQWKKGIYLLWCGGRVVM